MTKRDLSKLVRVQRTVTRRGRIYQQFYYVKPAEVLATDRVVGNQQVLDEYRKVKAQGVNAKETFDMSKFTTLRFSGDRNEAYKYVEACGIKWKKCTHPGINWMRMVMAVDKKSNGELKQTLRAGTGKGVILNKKDEIIKLLNDDKIKHLDGKGKVRALKQIISYNDLPELASLLKVNWKASSDPAINNMRVQMALVAYMQMPGDSIAEDFEKLAHNVEVSITRRNRVLEKRKAEEEAKKKEEEAKRLKEEAEKKRLEEEKKKGTISFDNRLKNLKYLDASSFNLHYSQGTRLHILLDLMGIKDGDISSKKKFADKLGLDYSKADGRDEREKVDRALNDYFDSDVLLGGTFKPEVTYDVLIDKLGLNTEKDLKDSYDDNKDSKLEIPKNAPERKKNIINMLNNINTTKDLKLIIKSGMIPEDDQAKAYIKDISSAYETVVTNSDKNIDSLDRLIASGIGRYDSEVTKELYNEYNKAVPGIKTSYSLNSGRASRIFREGYEYSRYTNPTSYLPFRPAKSVDSYTVVSLPISQENVFVGAYDRGDYGGSKTGLYNVLSELDFSYGNYDGIELNADSFDTQNAYQSYDYVPRKSVDDVGGVRAIKHIVSSLGKDYEAEGKEILDSYTDMLQACNNIPRVAGDISRTCSFEDFENDVDETNLETEITSAVLDSYIEDGFTNDMIKDIMDGFYFNHITLEDIANGKFRDNNKNNKVHFDDNNGKERNIRLNDKAVDRITKVVIDFKNKYPEEFSRRLYDTTVKQMTRKICMKYSKDFKGYKNYALYKKVDALKKVDKKTYDRVMKDMFDLQGVDLYINGGTEMTGMYVDLDNFTDSMNVYYNAIKDNQGSSHKVQVYGGNLSVEDRYTGEKLKKRKAILGNLFYLKDRQEIFDAVSNLAKDTKDSSFNEQGANHTRQFNYWSQKSIRLSGVSDKGKLYQYSDAKAEQVSPKELDSRIQKELSEATILDPETLDNLTNQVNKVARDKININSRATNSFMMSAYTNQEDFMNTPYNDVNYKTLSDLSSYSSQAIKKKKGVEVRDPDTGRAKLSKKYGDNGYISYTARQQAKQLDKQTSTSSESTTDANINPLKKLRTDAYNKVHCSLAYCKGKEQKKVQDYITKHWDTDGTPLDPNSTQGYGAGTQKKYSYIRPDFVTGAYKINNSDAEDNLKQTVAKTGEKVHTYFHGTDKVGGCGIVGVDGKFRFSGDAVNGKKAGEMLGKGIYLADCVGKSSGYFGQWNNGYGNTGSLLVCDAVLGNYAVADGTVDYARNKKYDSVIMTAGTSLGGRGLRANEWCVRRNEMVAPKYIVDMRAKNRR